MTDTQRFTVTAEKTGAEYPHYAPELGVGWRFVLRFPGEKPRAFSCHKMARAFARRLQGRIAA